ncbi:MAG: hypothetical protein AAGA35_00675 [Patescibacteria group bacterium]
MSDFRTIGPLYCETPMSLPEGVVSTLEVFPIEPINAITSVFPALVGLYLVYWLSQRGQLLSPFLFFAVATAMTGTGSVMWHGLRTPFSLAIDWIPGVISFMVFMFAWGYYLKNRWWGYATLVGVFGGTWLFSAVASRLVESNGPPSALFFVVAIISAILLYFTWKRYGTIAWWGVGMLGCAIAAAIVRTVDLATCGILPDFGTHAFWHIFLGVTSLFGLIMIVKIDEARKKGLE